jgi:ribosomal protein S18 acetylase RimI-like enzyme
VKIRRLGVGDEEVVRQLAVRDPQTALLADDRTIMLAAFEDDEPVGFVLAYALPRRHGDAAMLSIYEIDVDAERRRAGIATALMHHLSELARERGIAEGFLLTNESNEAAMAFYASLAGERPNQDDVLWLLRF